MKKIAPFLWIKEGGKEALEFYTALFANSKVVHVQPIPGAPGAPGQFVANFELMGEPYMMIQGGENPMLAATGPISLVVECDTQAEIDKLWDAFKDGGKEIQCGWITDKYGITWQVVPAQMGELMSGDPAKAQRVMMAMLNMIKIDLSTLEAAAKGV